MMGEVRPMVRAVDGPTWVYYAYCKHGGLLYIGVARDVQARVKQHRAAKPWWDQEVDSMLAFVYPTRGQALAVEANAIRVYRPAYNIAGQASMECLPHEIAPYDYRSLQALDAKGRAC
jgi:predicted GIY-YIG superfamily endonuclease